MYFLTKSQAPKRFRQNCRRTRDGGLNSWLHREPV